MNSFVGKPFEVETVMNTRVANIIVSVLFGKRFDYQDSKFLKLLTLIGENMKLIGGTRIAVTVSFLFTFTSSKVHLLVQETMKTIY